GKAKSQVLFLAAILCGKIDTYAGRLKRQSAKLITNTLRSFYKIHIGPDAAVVREHGIGCYKISFRCFDSPRTPIRAYDPSYTDAVMKLNPGRRGCACQSLRDCANSLERIEGSCCVNQSGHESERAWRFFQTLSRDVSPDAKRLDDRLRQSRASQHRPERPKQEAQMNPGP